MHSPVHKTAARALTHHDTARSLVVTPEAPTRRVPHGAHVETHHVAETGDVIRISCTCALGRDHTYAQWLALDRKPYNSRQEAAEKRASQRQVL